MLPSKYWFYKLAYGLLLLGIPPKKQKTIRTQTNHTCSTWKRGCDDTFQDALHSPMKLSLQQICLFAVSPKKTKC